MRKLILLLIVLGSLMAAPVPSASASSQYIWEANGSSISNLNESYPATASYFFNSSNSYSFRTLIDGWATTRVYYFRSYADLQSLIGSLSPVKWPWVAYDPENWSGTPLIEQQDPELYMQLFGQLAHAHGFRVLMLPARNLAQTDTTCTASWHTYDQYYINCQLASLQ